MSLSEKEVEEIRIAVEQWNEQNKKAVSITEERRKELYKIRKAHEKALRTRDSK